MLRIFHKRITEPGGYCPVCEKLELRPVRREWRCDACGTRIPDGAYMALMRAALGPGPRPLPPRRQAGDG